MKKLVIFTFALTLMFSVNAQIETPQPSPFTKVEQKVGLTDVTLEYSRPSMKGREVFGNLVPFGKMWRTGANKNTMITFSNPVKIDGQDLKAGSYAIFVTPSSSSWDVVFYSDTENWGTPGKWDDAKVAAKTTVKAIKMPMNVETFTITFDNLTNSSAELGILWENTMATITFEVPTDTAVTAAIEKAMAGPSANDYYASAVYFMQQDKNLDKAKMWMDKAMAMSKEPAFWQLRQQSLLYSKMGDKKNAIATAKLSLEKSKKAENADYVKMNMDSLKEWGAM
ncbi:DUF2911 domain-containing protein [Winogradskyella sp. UBA3174]|uniref:DUF2911 domain-containing protein n=1 Tax=Winogradskyella sp. UBA3174 TaxID=1947785 RepID=UPI0025D336F8|nr:DUF2911 domain-containing protein [Winogradskyella sp. UBA3174]|tara:strand:- start:75355 stop:76200 length:846 start_codon:yes stop_codon:yes gene_type:complete